MNDSFVTTITLIPGLLLVAVWFFVGWAIERARR